MNGVPDYLDDGDPWAAPLAQGAARAYSDAGYAQPRRELDSEEFMAPPAPLEPKPVKAKAYKPFDPLDTPEYKDAALRRKQLHDTEQLFAQRLKYFDATEGAALKLDKTDIPKGFQTETDQMLKDRAVLGDNAGDAARAGRGAYKTPISRGERLLREKRKRLADDADYVSSARATYDEQTFLPLRSRLTARAGAPTAQDDVDYLAARGQPAPRSASAPNFTQRPAGTESAGEADGLARDGEEIAPAGVPDFLDDAGMGPAQGDALSPVDQMKRGLTRFSNRFGKAFVQNLGEGTPEAPGISAAWHAGEAPMANIPHIPQPETEYPTTIPGVSVSDLVGATNKVSDFLSGLTSKNNVGLAGALGLLGQAAAIPGAAGNVARKTMAAVEAKFAKDAAEGAGSAAGKLSVTAGRDDNAPGETAGDVAELLLNTGMAGAMAKSIKGNLGEPPAPGVPEQAARTEEGRVVEDGARVVEQPDLSRLPPKEGPPAPPAPAEATVAETPTEAPPAVSSEAPSASGKSLPPEWRITVQEPAIPGDPRTGFVQIDQIDSEGNNAGSISPEAAAAQGYAVPDLSAFKTGQYQGDLTPIAPLTPVAGKDVSVAPVPDATPGVDRGNVEQARAELKSRIEALGNELGTQDPARASQINKEIARLYRELSALPDARTEPAVAADPISSEPQPPETAPTGEPTNGYQRSEQPTEPAGRPNPGDGQHAGAGEPVDVRPNESSSGEQPRGGAGGGDVPVPGRAGPADTDLGQPRDASGALTESATEPGRGPVGIKNASVEQLREAFGLDPAEARSGTTNEQALEGAAATLERYPGAARALVADFNEQPRALTPEENLLISHEINRIRVERDAIRTQQDEAARTGDEDTLATLDKRAQALGEEFDRVGSVADRTGTLQSSALRTRQAMLNEDFSLAEMERRQRVANRGEPVTPDQQARINKLHADYQAATKALEETRTTLETERATRAAELAVQNVLRGTSEAPVRQSPPGRIRQYINDQASKAEARIMARRAEGRLFSGLDPTELPDYARVAAKLIADGLDAGVELVKKFGKAITPHIPEILREAKNVMDSVALDRDIPAERRSTADAIRAKLADGESISDLGGYVNALAEQYAQQGIRAREPLVDALHATIKEIDPKITREQVRDSLSGYGKTTKLNQQDPKPLLRQFRGELQQLAKLEDMQRGNAPAKTGPERRVVGDEERRLIKQVEDAKKKGGYAVTDPATQLKSSLASIKTRLTNEIKDLDFQIATGKKTVKTKTPAPSDAEVDTLTRRRDELKALYDETFPTPPKTEAQRAQQATDALTRSIEEVQRQIRTAEVFPAGKKPAVSTPAVDALRKRLTDLQTERQHLRDSFQPRPDPTPRPELTDAQRAKLATRALERSIEDYTARINEGAFQRRTNAPKAPRTAELDALRERRDALKAQHDALKALAEPEGKTEMQTRQDAYKASVARQTFDLLEQEARQQRGDFTPKYKAPPLEMEPAMVAAKADRELVKNRVRQNQQLEDRRNRTTGQKVKDTALDVLNAPRSLMTSMDLSAVLRQGSFIGLGNPRMAAKSIGPMLKALMSERNAAIVEQEIASRPNAPRYKDSNLYLAPKDDVVLTHREETMRSNLAEKIPLLGRGVKASQRAYVGYLNKLRADSFDALASTLEGAGKKMTQEEARAIANYINVATGRGELGRYAGAAEAMSTVLFSPCLMASRFQVLAGQPLYRAAKASPRVRNAIAGEYAKYLAGLGTVLALGALAGATVEKDPRSSDFGKLKFGNTRVDVMGGLAQNAVLMARLASGSTKNEIGDTKSLVAEEGKNLRYGDASIPEVLGNFGRSKLAPVPGAALDLRQGSNMVGEKVTPLSTLVQMLLPLWISPKDIQAIMQEHGMAAGSAIELLNFLGAGVQHYENRHPGVRPEAAQAARDVGQKFPAAVKPKPVDPRRPYTDDEIKQYKREVDEQVSAGLMRDATRLRAMLPEQAKARVSAIASEARVLAEARLRMRHR